MWGYDESREDLTYEHWHTVPEDRRWLYESRGKGFPAVSMRVITALVVQMMGYCLDKINRAISL
jgi:hypothetical protein